MFRSRPECVDSPDDPPDDKPSHPTPGVRRFRVAGREVIVRGVAQPAWRDLYHHALSARWSVFLLAFMALFNVLNVVFASLYMLGDDPIANLDPPNYLGAFFFSVETLATVGYGDMYPRTHYAHWIATLETLTGVLTIAAGTGLAFARLSRPRAHIRFARAAVVQIFDGQPTLMLRAANARHNVVTGASATLTLMRVETTVEGERYLRLHDLTLVRDTHPALIFGWNLMHTIDASSPLSGETAASLAASNAMLMLTIEGIDEATAQTLHAHHSWRAAEIRWQHRFVDIFDDSSGRICLDYANFDAIEPQLAPRRTGAE